MFTPSSTWRLGSAEEGLLTIVQDHRLRSEPIGLSGADDRLSPSSCANIANGEAMTTE
jgi:hypothetical protein